MLSYLTDKQCEQLGINPEERTSGQLTVWFKRRGNKLEVQRVLPAVKVATVQSRLNGGLDAWVLSDIPEGQVYKYHLGSEWYVKDADGDRVTWQRRFHDYARKALSKFIVELDDLLTGIDAQDDVRKWAVAQAKDFVRLLAKKRFLQRFAVHVVPMCSCNGCPKPEKITGEFLNAAGYFPLYTELTFSCRHDYYRVLSRLFEATGTHAFNEALARERAAFASELARTTTVTPRRQIEA